MRILSPSKRAEETDSRMVTPSISTVPASASTVTTSPFWNMPMEGMESIMGIDEMTAPVATMVSADSFMTAAGCLPWTMRSYMTNDPTVLPFPLGNTRTFPATFPPFPTRTSPVAPSTPPRKLRGSGMTRTSPLALPGDIMRPSNLT